MVAQMGTYVFVFYKATLYTVLWRLSNYWLSNDSFLVSYGFIFSDCCIFWKSPAKYIENAFSNKLHESEVCLGNFYILCLQKNNLSLNLDSENGWKLSRLFVLLVFMLMENILYNIDYLSSSTGENTRHKYKDYSFKANVLC